MFDLPRTEIKTSAELSPSDEAVIVTAYGECEGIGMGLLSNGQAYLTQRGLAALCGVQNAHIGNISRDWHLDKPRILAVRARLARFGDDRDTPHRVLTYQGRRLYCYDLAVCQAVLDYYAVDAGAKTQTEAQVNRVRFRGNGLLTFINDAMMPAKAEPLRFAATDGAADMDTAWTAWTAHIWGLYALSFWLAVAYLKTLRERAEAAEWNRLGFYVPLGTILEIQAEMMEGMLAAAEQSMPISFPA